jgi:hypothetical protein
LGAGSGYRSAADRLAPDEAARVRAGIIERLVAEGTLELASDVLYAVARKPG